MLEGSLTMRASMPRFSMARRVRSTRAANSARLKCNVGVMLGGTGSCRGTTGREAGRGAICGGSLGEPGAALEGTSRRARGERSEEHTSELQSLMRISYAVFCL